MQRKQKYAPGASTPPHAKAPGKSANGAHSSKEVSKMRTEADIKAKLDELRAAHKSALELRLVWRMDGMQQKIEALEWVLAMWDEL